mmetsp:Transcript_25293/g.66142  ORF Transcript_25293/g.66142 Transcript_25293/m.66142 type:complete len:103 (-) Transcript_25293:1030-1338(-)
MMGWHTARTGKKKNCDEFIHPPQLSGRAAAGAPQAPTASPTSLCSAARVGTPSPSLTPSRPAARRDGGQHGCAGHTHSWEGQPVDAVGAKPRRRCGLTEAAV